MLQSRRVLAGLALFSAMAPMISAANLPRKAPELAINIVGGKPLLLSQYKGKVVAVVFILTYCSHCQKTVRLLSKAQADYGARGFQVVASAIEENAAAAVPGFLRTFNPPFPVGYNVHTVATDFLQYPVMLILKMPGLAFVDREGTIRAQYTGEDAFFAEGVDEKNLRDKIEELLKDGAPAVKKTASRKSVPATK
jgi:thiol-disulfide isomerase/thioredoxin